MKHFRQLKIIRTQNKLKQYQIADALGISRSTYCSYETGRRCVDLDTLVKLSQFYNLPIDAFLQDSFNGMVEDRDGYETDLDTTYLSQLSGEEIALIAKYRAMSKEDKKEVRDLADSKIESKP